VPPATQPSSKPLGSLVRAGYQEKNMENLLLKKPKKFKK
jgi:hypothetical protein